MNNNTFKKERYTDKYYHRHFVQYREWENAIGKHIVETFKPLSIIDLGCGVGSYLEGAFHAGCKDICGIEISFYVAKKYIVKEIIPYISYGDITKKMSTHKKYDCVMSFETGEHIEPEGTDIFIDNLTSLTNKYIVFTAAPPGQGGTGHINLRKKEFWIEEIISKSFLYQEEIIENFLSVWREFKVPGYILRNLMVFKKI